MIAVQMKIKSSRNASNNAIALSEQSAGILSAAKLAPSACETLLSLADDNLDAAIRDLETALNEMRIARNILKDKRKA